MAEILSVQSAVVFGRVGHSAATFALERLGHDVWPIPTVLLSSHTGYPGFAGRRLPAAELETLAGGLRAIGAFRGLGALHSGYLGTEPIAGFVEGLLAELRAARPGLLYLCDPVLGDTGTGLYLPEAVGRMLRDRLLPVADIATPNEWELGWLTGLSPTAPAEVAAAARDLAARGPARVFVTGVRAGLGPEEIGILALEQGRAHLVRTPRFPVDLHGTGDLAAALILAVLLDGGSAAAAAERAASAIHAVMARTVTEGRAELALVAAQDALVRPPQLFRAEPLAS